MNQLSCDTSRQSASWLRLRLLEWHLVKAGNHLNGFENDWHANAYSGMCSENKNNNNNISYAYVTLITWQPTWSAVTQHWNRIKYAVISTHTHTQPYAPDTDTHTHSDSVRDVVGVCLKLARASSSRWRNLQTVANFCWKYSTNKHFYIHKSSETVRCILQIHVCCRVKSQRRQLGFDSVRFGSQFASNRMWQRVIYPSINAQQISWQRAAQARHRFPLPPPPHGLNPLFPLNSLVTHLAAHLG